jgi:hypothetical protein
MHDIIFNDIVFCGELTGQFLFRNLLLQQTSSFDLALSSVRIFLEGCGSGDDGERDRDEGDDGDGICTDHLLNTTSCGRITDQEKTKSSSSSSSAGVGTDCRKYRGLFDKLQQKFPSDPEHTSIRLVRLKFAYSFSRLVVGSTAPVATQVDEDG